MIINTRADYDAAPQQVQERFLLLMANGAKQWKWKDGQWQLVTDMSGAEALGFTTGDLPDVPDPPEPDYNPDERATAQLAAEIREQRDRLIAATDYAVQPDSPHDTPEMRAYRQALRDVPQQKGFPESVEWPEL
mgnify:CR=1 FL=1